MPDSTITNIASAAGTYDGAPVSMDSEPVTTLLVDGLAIAKTASKEAWVNGTLVYTITLTNNAAHPLENAVVADTLDPARIALVEGSVMVDGAVSADYTYVEVSGLLTVNIPAVAVGQTVAVTFKVERQ